MTTEQTVLITGATSGIGYELAKIFANEGYHLVLVARNDNKLNQIKEELQKRRNAKVYIIQEDLSQIGAGDRLFREVKRLKLEVDILINNAGAGYTGLFHEKDFEQDIHMMQLNMITLTELTKLFANEMVKNKRGKILNVASTGSYHGGPYTAVYYATKAYVLSFSEALSIELKPYGIVVSALCPGATKTDFARRAGKQDSSIAMEAKKVAEIAYKELMKDKKVIIPGLRNKLLVKIPRMWASHMVGKYQKALLINK
ncbi:MAG: fabG2 [Clostridia bacterium]|jgi:short-subunit dehydrogenase|nr:fabG2 [Clostridia bacterium]